MSTDEPEPLRSKHVWDRSTWNGRPAPERGVTNFARRKLVERYPLSVRTWEFAQSVLDAGFYSHLTRHRREICRRSATKALCELVRQGEAVRVSRGKYRAAKGD